MPYKSKAQQAYFNSHRKALEAQGVNVSEWNSASKGASLPEHSKNAPKNINLPKRKGNNKRG